MQALLATIEGLSLNRAAHAATIQIQKCGNLEEHQVRQNKELETLSKSYYTDTFKSFTIHLVKKQI